MKLDVTGWGAWFANTVHYVFCCHNEPGVQIFGVLFCLSQHLWTANVRWYCICKVLDTSYLSLFLFLCKAQATRSKVNESLCRSIIEENFRMNSTQIKSIWICYVFGCCLGVCVSIRGRKTELSVFASTIRSRIPEAKRCVLSTWNRALRQLRWLPRLHGFPPGQNPCCHLKCLSLWAEWIWHFGAFAC